MDFFSYLYGGNCIEGRLRDLFDRFVSDRSNHIIRNFQETAQEMAMKVMWYLTAIGETPSKEAIISRLFIQLQPMVFRSDQQYAPEGKVTQITFLQQYWEDSLQYSPRFSICDSDDKKGDYHVGLSKLQAIFRGNKTRERYRMEDQQVMLTLEYTVNRVVAIDQPVLNENDSSVPSVLSSVSSLFWSIPWLFGYRASAEAAAADQPLLISAITRSIRGASNKTCIYTPWRRGS